MVPMEVKWHFGRAIKIEPQKNISMITTSISQLLKDNIQLLSTIRKQLLEQGRNAIFREGHRMLEGLSQVRELFTASVVNVSKDT